MYLFVGDLNKADLLLNLYGVPEWQHVILADIGPRIGHIVGGRRVCDLNSIPGKWVSRAIVLGGDWDYPQYFEAFKRIGVKSERIICGDNPHLLHQTVELVASPISDLRKLVSGCIYNDLVHRPWYAWPMIVAAATAERMGLRSFCVVEFGVFTGVGLKNMASLAQFIGKGFGLDIKVLGFDTGAGLPSVADWRDHPELWYTGELVMPDMEGLKKALPSNAHLILGDIASTLDGAVAKHVSPECPLGFVSLDVDTHSSSVACLKVFDIAPDKLLPVVPMYVDDSYVNISQTRFAGEWLAINEFNADRELRKIDHKIVRTDRPPQPWHHTMHFAHIFDHPMRAKSSGKSLIGLNHFYF